VKVLVQPQVVLDHGTHIEEVEHPTIAIPAEEWPAYSGERFPRELEEWQARVDAESIVVEPVMSSSQGAPKRSKKRS